jgi:hypothetical protein
VKLLKIKCALVMVLSLALTALVAHSSLRPVLARAADRPQFSDRGIPARLRPSLNQRLQRFVEAQNLGDWATVADLLGRYRGVVRGMLYTEAHKECLISQMRSWPMISFKEEKVLFSTAILAEPLSKRWWSLWGTAEIRTPDKLSTVKTEITAYRDAGQWYFTPPNYDGGWEREHVTEADQKAERNSELELQMDPECPVELLDVSVKMDPEYASLREVSFTLRNKTDKRLTGYSLRLGRVGARCFGLMSGVPLAIEPNATSPRREEETYSAYGFYCEGIMKHRLVIDEVNFADGSRWIDPRFRRKGPLRGCLF